MREKPLETCWYGEAGREREREREDGSRCARVSFAPVVLSPLLISRRQPLCVGHSRRCAPHTQNEMRHPAAAAAAPALAAADTVRPTVEDTLPLFRPL